MPLNTPRRDNSPNYAPQSNALVVCAGTVTCRSVSDMGLGFGVFKSTFPSSDWRVQLDQQLQAYHKKSAPMPAYIPSHQHGATNGGLIGGVGTVPVFNSTDLHPEDGKNQEVQYKEAVRGAILDAQQNKRPLYIQPLGTGGYGWPTKKAAEIFISAIQECDPKGELDITVPIYNPGTGSKDMAFKNELDKLYGQAYGKDKVNPELSITRAKDVAAPSSSVVNLAEYVTIEKNSTLVNAAANVMLSHDNAGDDIKVLTNKIDLASLPAGYYMRFIPVGGGFHLYGIEVDNKGGVLVHENINKSLLAKHGDSLFADNIRALNKTGQVVFRTGTSRRGGLDLHSDLARQYCETGSVGKSYYNHHLSNGPSYTTVPKVTATVVNKAPPQKIVVEPVKVDDNAERVTALLNKLKLNPKNDQHLKYWQGKVSFVGGDTYKDHAVPHTIKKLMTALEGFEAMSYDEVKQTVNTIRYQPSDSLSSRLGLSGIFRSAEVSNLREVESIEECDFTPSMKL